MQNDALNQDPVWWDSWRGVLFAYAAVIHTLERDIQAHSGISLAILDVMARLHDAPDNRLRMTELQERALFSLSGLTRVVDRMEAAGLVNRENVPGDRRGVLVALTATGLDTYRAAMARHQDDVERVFADRLTPSQHAAVAGGLWSFWHETEAETPPLPD